MLTLKKIEKNIEGNKRQYFPYVLTDICSTCGETLEMDLSEGHYLSEPIFGQPKKVWMYCIECGEEGKEFEVIPRITLELVEKK